MNDDLGRDLERIRRALRECIPRLRDFAGRVGDLDVAQKRGAGPVSEADEAIDTLLRERLPEPGDGWLSEETIDDAAGRRACRRVWIVDPLDGTKEFLAGIPEWSVSIGLVVDGVPVAGGIANPATGVEVVGAVGHGVWRNDSPARPMPPVDDPTGAVVLASRSEVDRGLWEDSKARGLHVRGIGSVAWKLALVAAGDAHATWTHVPKHTWDVAGGFALVRAAGGLVGRPDRSEVAFDESSTRLPGAVGLAPGTEPLHAFAFLD